jgi:hypothetical protein
MCFEPKKTTLLAVLAAVLFVVAGCGKKGDPLPRLRDIPQTATDLSVLQQGRLLVLDVAYPAVTVSGMPLGGIDALDLLQLTKPSTGGEIPTVPPAEVEATAETLLTLRGAELQAAIAGDRIRIRVPLAAELPAEPLAHYFAVRTTKGDETSGLSNVVGLVPVEPPAAPQNLTATAKPAAIELTWESEGEVEGFDVFRREAQERAYGAVLGRTGAGEKTLVDRRVQYGKKYIYTVRAIASLEPLVLSDEAGEREIDYQDRFPPPLPASFVALGERSRVRLRWESSDAPDVAGYVLYRREPRRDEFHRINDELVTGVEYIDRGLVAGFTYEYQIQAVDESGNEGKISDPVSTEVR